MALLVVLPEKSSLMKSQEVVSKERNIINQARPSTGKYCVLFLSVTSSVKDHVLQ